MKLHNKSHSFTNYFHLVMKLILPAELDFSTLPTKRKSMLKYKQKLFISRKKTRNSDGKIVKCYWPCSTEACKASLNYCVDPNNVLANEDGTGRGIHDIVLQKDHDIDLCTITSYDIVRRVARTNVISQGRIGTITIYLT